MNYKIEAWPAFKVAGFKYPLKTAQAFEKIPAIWDDMWKTKKIDRLLELFRLTDYRPAGYLGIAIGGQWGASEDMDYMIGVTNHVDAEGCKYVSVPDGMSEVSIRAATWLVVEANGPLPDAVQSVYKQLHTEWLPGSGYQLDDLPAIECYLQENRQEVWIAVKPES